MKVPTLPVEIKGGLTINIPVGSLVPPTGEMVALFDRHCDHRNWKMAVAPVYTFDRQHADDFAYTLDWYCGGHETEERQVPGGTLYVVKSLGYYHYIGA